MNACVELIVIDKNDLLHWQIILLLTTRLFSYFWATFFAVSPKLRLQSQNIPDKEVTVHTEGHSNENPFILKSIR